MGKKGVLLHNLPLLLGMAGAVLVLRRRPRQRPECVLALAWCAGVWLIYAAASTNASGVCCSVRWFVPLLAPGFFLLALLLRDFPEYERDFLWLSGWGAVLGAVMAWGGPWRETPRLAYWVVVGLALAGWMWIAVRRGPGEAADRTWAPTAFGITRRPLSALPDEVTCTYMTIEQVRQLYSARPFQAFDIHLADSPTCRRSAHG